jgi:hypothetical protein
MNSCSAEDINALKAGLIEISKVLATVETTSTKISGTKIEEINNRINLDCISSLGESDPSISRDAGILVKGLRAAVPQLKYAGNPRSASNLQSTVNIMINYLNTKYPTPSGGKKTTKRRKTKRNNTRKRTTRRRYRRYRK